MRPIRNNKAIAAALLLCCPVHAASGATAGPEIQTEDVTRFYAIYDRAEGHPPVAALQDYLDAGSEGLRSFARLRRTTAERIAEAIEAQPQLYSGARRCVAVLPGGRRRLAQALTRLKAIYADARQPPVTIVIGRGKPVGIGSPVTGLQIGLEALCGLNFMDADLEDRFVHVVSHEYVHVQQQRALVDDENPTVLEGSLVEGAAEFIGELISGGVSYAGQAAMVRGREAEIETAFTRDIDKRDLSDWLYNGSIETPGDLGYWVGYRIVKCFYARAPDKRAAVRSMIEMRDAKAFLAQSGWRAGGCARR